MTEKILKLPRLARKGCLIRDYLQKNPNEFPWKRLRVTQTFVDDHELCVVVESILKNDERYVFSDWYLSESEFAGYFFIENECLCDAKDDPIVKRILRLIEEFSEDE